MVTCGHRHQRDVLFFRLPVTPPLYTLLASKLRGAALGIFLVLRAPSREHVSERCSSTHTTTRAQVQLTPTFHRSSPASIHPPVRSFVHPSVHPTPARAAAAVASAGACVCGACWTPEGLESTPKRERERETAYFGLDFSSCQLRTGLCVGLQGSLDQSHSSIPEQWCRVKVLQLPVFNNRLTSRFFRSTVFFYR